jgi:hypothetical protein
MDAPTLNKPAGVLCEHCIVGKGCGIHDTRFPECRHFHCAWLIDAALGPEWQPELSHIVIAYDLEGRRLNAHADPLCPDAWRREPYYSQLKTWAANALPRGGQVVGRLLQEVSVFLPDGHVDLGEVNDDEYIFIENFGDGKWGARKVSEAEALTLRMSGEAPP